MKRKGSPLNFYWDSLHLHSLSLVSHYENELSQFVVDSIGNEFDKTTIYES